MAKDPLAPGDGPGGGPQARRSSFPESPGSGLAPGLQARSKNERYGLNIPKKE